MKLCLIYILKVKHSLDRLNFFFTFAKLLRNKVYVIGPLKYDVSFVVKFLFTTFATYLNYTKFNSVHMEVVLSGCIQRSCVNL